MWPPHSVFILMCIYFSYWCEHSLFAKLSSFPKRCYQLGAFITQGENEMRVLFWFFLHRLLVSRDMLGFILRLITAWSHEAEPTTVLSFSFLEWFGQTTFISLFYIYFFLWHLTSVFKESKNAEARLLTTLGAHQTEHFVIWIRAEPSAVAMVINHGSS